MNARFLFWQLMNLIVRAINFVLVPIVEVLSLTSKHCEKKAEEAKA